MMTIIEVWMFITLLIFLWLCTYAAINKRWNEPPEGILQQVLFIWLCSTPIPFILLLTLAIILDCR